MKRDPHAVWFGISSNGDTVSDIHDEAGTKPEGKALNLSVSYIPVFTSGHDLWLMTERMQLQTRQQKSVI